MNILHSSDTILKFKTIITSVLFLLDCYSVLLPTSLVSLMSATAGKCFSAVLAGSRRLYGINKNWKWLNYSLVFSNVAGIEFEINQLFVVCLL
jgi:hypothetical protein